MHYCSTGIVKSIHTLFLMELRCAHCLQWSSWWCSLYSVADIVKSIVWFLMFLLQRGERVVCRTLYTAVVHCVKSIHYFFWQNIGMFYSVADALCVGRQPTVDGAFQPTNGGKLHLPQPQSGIGALSETFPNLFFLSSALEHPSLSK